MAAIKSPGTGLKFYNKSVDDYSKGIKEGKEDKKLTAQRSKLKKSLTTLRNQAQSLTTQEKQATFNATAGKVLIGIYKYLKGLKSAKETDTQVRTKHLKRMKQFAVSVGGWNASTITQGEEEIGLDSLEDVDLQALEAQMEQPGFGEGSDDIDEQEVAETDAEQEAIPAAPPLQQQTPSQTPPQQKQPAPTGATAAQVKARLALLMPGVQQILKGDSTDKADVQRLMTSINGNVGKSLFDAAMADLNQLEPIVKNALKAAAEGGNKLNAAKSGWSTALAAVLKQIQDLQTAIAKEKDVQSGAAVLLLRSIQAQLPKTIDTQAVATEVENYLNGDDVITRAEEPNPWGVNLSIRGTLLPALQAVKQALPQA